MVTGGQGPRASRGERSDLGDVTARGRIALAAGSAARWSSRVTGRGAGAMIGGLVAMALDKSILRQLGRSRRTVLVTGTNGKSTTTRMTAAALGTLGPTEPQGRRHQATEPQGRRHQIVATNAEGANMDAGLVAALAGARDAELAALEVDEMHVPHVADAVEPAVIVLLNLSRDQLDRVGEINLIERTLRAGLARHPDTVVVANCDDVLMTSAAYDSPNVVWVAAGGGWANDSVSCPRSGEIIVRDEAHWYSTGTDFKRPTPQWSYDDENIYGPDGFSTPMQLALPGTVNRGNATQSVAAAVAMGTDPAAAVQAVSGVDEVAGRYSTVQFGAHTVRMLLAKNPAGWQEALSMVDADAGSVVISVNGQVPDGEDLSWLWDVNFEHFVDEPLARKAQLRHPVVAAGERGTDLAVRLGYAGVEHTLVHNAVDAIASCPPGHVEVVANYTAFLSLNRALSRG
jgi:UDP-N-acetylmuramyl tripeptide synthase